MIKFSILSPTFLFLSMTYIPLTNTNEVNLFLCLIAVPVLRLPSPKTKPPSNNTKTKALTLLSMVLKYRTIKYIPKINMVESNINVAISNPPLTSHGIGENNKNISFNGETKTVSQWADKIGISQDTLGARILNGWCIEKALTTPLLKSKNGGSKK